MYEGESWKDASSNTTPNETPILMTTSTPMLNMSNGKYSRFSNTPTETPDQSRRTNSRLNEDGQYDGQEITVNGRDYIWFDDQWIIVETKEETIREYGLAGYEIITEITLQFFQISRAVVLLSPGNQIQKYRLINTDKISKVADGLQYNLFQHHIPDEMDGAFAAFPILIIGTPEKLLIPSQALGCAEMELSSAKKSIKKHPLPSLKAGAL